MAIKSKAIENKKKVIKKQLAQKMDPLHGGVSVGEKVSVDKKRMPKPAGLTIDVFNTVGKAVEKMTLPKEIFGTKINKPLMAQAVRVYLANQRKGTSSTKTRGEVEGSTRKIYRQKGTGRARHGGIRAPIFVKGGIAFGPKPRDYSLSLPQKMKKAALISALSAKLSDGEIKILTGLEKIPPKTKEMATVFTSLSLTPKKSSILLVLPEKNDTLTRAVRNIEGVTYMYARQLHTYEILRARTVLFMKEAVMSLAVKEKKA